MRNDDGQMKCLSGTLTRIGEGLRGNVRDLGCGLSGSLNRAGEGLKGYVALVCTSNMSLYLTVRPDVVWLTPDMLSGEFDIISNVNWEIE